jgi:hypothetical protein
MTQGPIAEYRNLQGGSFLLCIAMSAVLHQYSRSKFEAYLFAGKVKQSRYWPGVAQRVPGNEGSQIS